MPRGVYQLIKGLAAIAGGVASLQPENILSGAERLVQAALDADSKSVTEVSGQLADFGNDLSDIRQNVSAVQAGLGALVNVRKANSWVIVVQNAELILFRASATSDPAIVGNDLQLLRCLYNQLRRKKVLFGIALALASTAECGLPEARLRCVIRWSK